MLFVFKCMLLDAGHSGRLLQRFGHTSGSDKRALINISL